MDVDRDEEDERRLTGAMFDSFPVARLPEVADDIADLFGAEGGAEPAQQLVIGPPIEVYVAGMVDAQKTPVSLVDIAHSTKRFHHQVLAADGRPLGYALTRLTGDGIIVCKISESSDFASAIEHGLSVLRRLIRQDCTVRLLSIPELQLDAIWVVTLEIEGREVLVVRVPPESRLTPMDRLSEKQVVEVLMEHPPLAGTFIGLAEILCDRPVRDFITGSIGDDDTIEDAPPVTWEPVHVLKEMAA